jgi:hypothetical protein
VVAATVEEEDVEEIVSLVISVENQDTCTAIAQLVVVVAEVVAAAVVVAAVVVVAAAGVLAISVERQATCPESVPVVVEVVVKPPNARCTTPGNPGVVTGVGEHGAVEVDKMPRHVSDVRVVQREPEGSQDNSRPQRQRNLPLWLNNYIAT